VADPLHSLELTKPDGRRLFVYGRQPIEGVRSAPSPSTVPVSANPHLRWHPLRGEWVAYASYRQERTFLPAAETNPLRPTTDPDHPTELPSGAYDVAVFENLFPTLSPSAHDPPVLEIPTAPAAGHCEVVVFSQDPGASLGRLPLDHVELLIQVWAERTAALGRQPGIQYVLPFENRGVEVGSTLHHPHGQLYAYPFVPPIPACMNRQEREHHEKTGRPLLQDMIESELRVESRLIYAGPHAIAFVPPCARYPYEVWIAPRTATPLLGDLGSEERRDLASALKTALLKLDGLWQRPSPYVMAWYQAPTDGVPHPESHTHAEVYPAHRSRHKLKYLAGTEIAAGMFANDTLPEERARELRAVPVEL
jgi:UDPglucose--hexose-1-phosphate uridylyltransferase